MKNLVKELCLYGEVGRAEARSALGLVIALLEAKIRAGDSIDLGFLKLNAVTTQPAAFVTNFDPKEPRTFMVGQSRKWNVVIRKSWLEKVKPKWSRF